jgi:septum formation protein
MINYFLHNKKIILASKSPRRQQLLTDIGIDYELKTKEVDESFPDYLKEQEIAIYIAEKKANAFKDELRTEEILLTADTIVCLGNEVLGKPTDYDDAVAMLGKLSGKMHKVITGVTLASIDKTISFSVTTLVYFKSLSAEEITFYLHHFKPYDKAGAYGIQEWIGYIGVERIEGSYFNVMGLPIMEVYEAIKEF